MNQIDKYNEANLFGKANNLHLTIIESGHIEYKMKLEEKHLALPALIHGGAIAGLMDAILSVAAFTMVSEEGKHVATVDFTINYLKPITTLETIRGIGKVMKRGKKIIVSRGEIYNENEEIVALGTGTMMIV
jgi:acyl-CoA thioesterase